MTGKIITECRFEMVFLSYLETAGAYTRANLLINIKSRYIPKEIGILSHQHRLDAE